MAHSLHRRNATWRFVAAFLCLITLQVNAQVRSLDLREMVGSAGMIFTGRVVEVRGGLDEHGDLCTFSTFVVDQPLRNVFGPAVSIKQFGGDDGTRSMRLPHVRYFEPGERLVVMLYPISGKGFTGPVGLSQSVWHLTPDGMVTGVQTRILRSLGSTIDKYHLLLNDSVVSIPLPVFIAIINDIEQGGAK